MSMTETVLLFTTAWTFMAQHEHSWHSMNIPDTAWISMTQHEHPPCHRMNVHVTASMSMTVHKCSWHSMSMTQHKCSRHSMMFMTEIVQLFIAWTFMAQYEHLWHSMNIHDATWISSTPQEHTCHRINVHVTAWMSMTAGMFRTQHESWNHTASTTMTARISMAQHGCPCYSMNVHDQYAWMFTRHGMSAHDMTEMSMTWQHDSPWNNSTPTWHSKTAQTGITWHSMNAHHEAWLSTLYRINVHDSMADHSTAWLLWYGMTAHDMTSWMYIWCSKDVNGTSWKPMTQHDCPQLAWWQNQIHQNSAVILQSIPFNNYFNVG